MCIRSELIMSFEITTDYCWVIDKIVQPDVGHWQIIMSAPTANTDEFFKLYYYSGFGV